LGTLKSYGNALRWTEYKITPGRGQEEKTEEKMAKNIGKIF
jgi:hypothetical protein